MLEGLETWHGGEDSGERKRVMRQEVSLLSGYFGRDIEKATSCVKSKKYLFKKGNHESILIDLIAHLPTG